jgi:dienelactone hydrolase
LCAFDRFKLTGNKSGAINQEDTMHGKTRIRPSRLLVPAYFASLALVLQAGSAAEEPAAPLPIDKRIQKLAETAPLTMQFQGTTADECRRWQAQFGAKLKSLLGPYQPPKEWRVVVERTVDLADHRREELVLVADGHPPLPMYLLVPKGDLRRRPGIVAVHGHGQFGYDAVVGRELTPGIEAEVKKLNYDYGRQLVQRGYVVAAPCLTPFGRRLGDRKAYRGQDPCGVTFIRLQMLGKLLMAENLRDVLWSLEFLSRQPSVDAERLGCVGLSYGGRMTMLATAVRPRIKVAVISGALNCMQERIQLRYGCGAQIIPGLLQFGDVPEISGLIAPRPCLWEAGKQDEYPPEWVERAWARIGRAYAALGASEELHLDHFAGGHVWHGERAYALLETVLGKP